MTASLLVSFVFQIGSYSLIAIKWESFFKSITSFCIIPTASWLGDSKTLNNRQIIYSKWHDYDNIYRFNDFLIDNQICTPNSEIN